MLYSQAAATAEYKRKEKITMILYHLDRQNTFPNNSNEQLIHPIETMNVTEANNFFNSEYPNGISYQGKRYLNPFDIRHDTLKESEVTCSNYNIYTIEYVFEMVRLLYFSDRPSRFTSLFACKTMKDAKRWYDILKPNLKHSCHVTVKKIETNGKIFIADSFWRDDKFYLNDIQHQVFSPFAYHEWARKYWKGDFSTQPVLEVLCELPVTVLESIPISKCFNYV